MITPLNPADGFVRFDLLEIDPDHRSWLKEEAEERGMAVDEMLNLERSGAISIKADYSGLSSFPVASLAEELTVTVECTDNKLKMAIKRLAAEEGISPEQWAAHAIATQVLVEEEECQTDILTGLYRPKESR